MLDSPRGADTDARMTTRSRGVDRFWPGRAVSAVCGLALLGGLACSSAGAPGSQPPAAASVAPGAPATAASAGAPAPANVGPPMPLRVAFAAQSATNTPLWVGYERGLFREQGLDVDLQFLAGTRTDQGVITGDTPVGFGANVVATRLSGADIVGVAGLVNKMSYYLYARPDAGIRSPADLRGKSLLVTSPGATNYLAGLLMLRHYGLEPFRDVSIQPSPGTVEQLAIMAQGLSDAAMFSPPANLKAHELGLLQIANLTDSNIPLLMGTVGTSRGYMREHAEAVRRFVRGYVMAVALTRKDGESAKTILGKYSETDDPVILEESYRWFRDLWGRPDFRVPVEAVRSVLSVLDAPGADTAQPEDFIDNRFVDELEQSGFIRDSGALN
jgi:NitT/TauT family transport system substrate-binding protein